MSLRVWLAAGAVAMLLLVIWGLRSRIPIGLAAILMLLVVMQTLWMLPALDARVEAISQQLLKHRAAQGEDIPAAAAASH